MTALKPAASALACYSCPTVVLCCTPAACCPCPSPPPPPCHLAEPTGVLGVIYNVHEAGRNAIETHVEDSFTLVEDVAGGFGYNFALCM